MQDAPHAMRDVVCASDLRAVALNVKSLSAKLEFLLSLPFDVFCLSEVRMSWSGQRALSRIASTYGFAASWSVAPPLLPPLLLPQAAVRFSPRAVALLCILLRMDIPQVTRGEKLMKPTYGTSFHS